MKILTIIGARPQFIKAAPVSKTAAAMPGMEEILVHTGQHYDANMSDVFFDELEIPKPRHHLGIGSAGHGAQTGRMLEGVEGILLAERPDWVLVYGDTNSTLAGALAAVKLHIPVAHVEAGLRSFNRRMPEEINRVLTDHAADLLFAPTETAVRNLRHEGLGGDKVLMVGDVMQDAALHYGEMAAQKSQILEALGLTAGTYALATIHRAENTDNPARLQAIFDGLAEVSRQVPIVLPVHPRTRGILERNGFCRADRPALRLIDPVGYLDMVQLEKNARLIATDSGGVQKEAYFHRVPCVTLRDETEWVELVEQGWNRLVSPRDKDAVVPGILDALRAVPGSDLKLYGNGDAARRIIETMAKLR